MKHQLHKTSVLCLASFVLSLSAQAAFTRLATETYPGGGGGGPTNGVTAAQATNIAAHVVSRDVASWAMKGQPKPATDLSGITNLVAASSAASTNYTDSVKANYLPLAGGTMTGDINFPNGAALCPTEAGQFALYMADHHDCFAFEDDGVISALYPDGTPVVTSNMLTRVVDASTLAATNFVKAGYLPLDGSQRMTGDLYILGHSIVLDGKPEIYNNNNCYIDFIGEPGDITSRLTPDDSPVVTSNMLNGVLAPATNAIQTALVETNALLRAALDNEEDERKTADSKLLTKESTSYPATRNIKWSGYNLVLMGPMLFETWSKIKAGTASSNEELPDYITSRLAAYQTNLVVSASTADKVLKNDGTTLYWGEGGGGGGGSPLAGAQYNFHNGTNFTWCIYATLTNALVKMGATVTNPPALDEAALVHPIVVTASTSTGSPLSGKTYDFHSGANFVKDVYQVLEQAVRDLGATTINTPTF